MTRFKLAFNQRNFNGTRATSSAAIKMGAMRGKGSTSRMFYWCNERTPNPSLCINQFIHIQPSSQTSPPIPPPIQIGDDYYLAGIFNTNPLLVFGSDENQYFQSPSINTVNGNQTAYIVKYNSDGIPIWATKLGYNGSLALNTYGFSISIIADTDNSIYISGRARKNTAGTSEFNLYNAGNDTTPSIILSIPSTQHFMWIAKYDLNGNALWGTYITGEVFTPTLTVDKEYNLYISMTLQSNNTTANIYENGNIFVKTYSTGFSNTSHILVKYNTNGIYKWSTIITGNSSTNEATICCDNNSNIIMSGFQFGTMLYDIYNSNGTLATNLNIQNSGIYVVKFNSLGFAEWCTKIQDTNDAGGISISIDKQNNIYVSSNTFYSSFPGENPLSIYSANNLGIPSLTFTLPISSGSDLFLAKYNTNGIAQWYSRIGGIDSEFQSVIQTNSNNNIIITGQTISDTLQIFNSNNTTTTPSSTITLSPVGLNIFLVNFDLNGNAIWSTYLGTSNDEVSRPIVVNDSNNNIIVTGMYDAGDIYFYKPNNTTPIQVLSLTSINNNNTYLVKYNSNGLPIWVAQNKLNAYIPVVGTSYKPWV